MTKEDLDVQQRKPLLSREVIPDFGGSTADSLNSYDYNTYIKPYAPVETGVYWWVQFSCYSLKFSAKNW